MILFRKKVTSIQGQCCPTHTESHVVTFTAGEGRLSLLPLEAEELWVVAGE